MYKLVRNVMILEDKLTTGYGLDVPVNLTALAFFRLGMNIYLSVIPNEWQTI